MATDDPDPDPPATQATPAAPAADPPAAPAEPTVKELLDAKTVAELERWFGLPSFQELAERKEEPPPLDPEIEAVRERRAKAIAAIDPALVDRVQRRVESGEAFQFQSRIDVRIDLAMPRIDLDRLEMTPTLAEPREVEIPDQLRDDLAEVSPQAILRDLHRPELYFDKQFELVDAAADQRFDIVAAVDEAMRASWKLPPFERSLPAEGRALIAELKEERMRSIAHLLPNLPNRRVTEP